jgi:hypothetical protein
MSEAKEYTVMDVGLAGFLLFVLSEDFFLGAEKRPNSNNAQFVFSDTCAGNSCKELVRLYHSGAQLTDVKEYANCIKTMTRAMQLARKDESGLGIRYRGF